MSRRAITLVSASVLVFVLGLIVALLPVPYVVLEPGPTTNTLGSFHNKSRLIAIKGHKTYPTNGHLNFVTVAYQGGPGHRVDLFTALRGWLDSSIAVVPEQTIFPEGESTKQVEKHSIQAMSGSQDSATAAALHELKIPVPIAVSIVDVRHGLPAEGKLRAGDVIVAVDGTKVTGVDSVIDVMNKHKPGDTVRLAVERDGKKRTVSVTTTESSDKPGKAVLGIVLRGKFRFPFTVKISVGDIGGPSAGLMFSLGIYDKLTPQNITGGKFIAGTGTITPQGKVGPIGGIQQKMVAARRAGATIFLTPAQNCKDAVATAPEGLRPVKVQTMHGALRALKALRTGNGTVPDCSGA